LGMRSIWTIPVIVSILILGSLGLIQEADAVTFTATQNGNWNAASTWGGAGPPTTVTPTDTVIIPSGITVSINAGVTVLNVGTITNFGTININSGGIINNLGIIDNLSTIIHKFGGIIDNSGGTILNSGGTISVSPNTDITGGILGDVTQAELDALQAIIDQLTDILATFSSAFVTPILDAVDALVNSGDLDSRDASSLTRSLERSLDVAERADGVACKGATNFVDDINQLVSDGSLTAEQAQPLLERANDLLVTCTP